ncbi:MAG: CRISPR system precrRNA processing endoribonuclease RAMP protein Cas6 [Syntrophobacterales bacterium]|nr:CRISPR system precrRNA processing endoribonuclease RAMP protein Cas6 [Syntrophobacterales bacterium]
MRFGRYHFTAILEEEALLPAYKGSTFRGVFGAALKQVVCALRQQECPACLLRQQCLYPRIFDTTSPASGSPPPQPFVIEPPPETRTHYQPGDAFDFTLLLFGWANDCLPYFVYAFREMGHRGIGRRRGERRGRFRLHRLTAPGAGVLYREEDGSLQAPPPLELEPPAPGPPGGPEQELTLTLLTPLRLKFRNHLQPELPFHVLMRAVLRRLAALWQHYGGGEPALDYRGLIARAQEVAVVRDHLRWFDWRRYSSRQEAEMYLGGLVGEITYRGRLGEFLPLITLAAPLHVGKNTTFGLGKIHLSY